ITISNGLFRSSLPSFFKSFICAARSFSGFLLILFSSGSVMLFCSAVFSSSFCASSGVSGEGDGLACATAAADGDTDAPGLAVGEALVAGLGDGDASGSTFDSLLACEIILGANGSGVGVCPGTWPAASCDWNWKYPSG